MYFNIPNFQFKRQIMNLSKLLLSVSSLVLLFNLGGCGKDSSSPLSIALDPYTGTNKLYEDWADKGFSYSNDYFGVPIYKIAGGKTYIETGKFKTYQLWTEAPRGKVREAVSKACRVPETDFKDAGGQDKNVVVDEGAYTLTCNFGPGIEPGTFSILILRSPKQ